MENKKGLSDVVTTVIIIALSLVAIAVVWVVVNNLITSNAGTITGQSNCLKTNLEIASVSVNAVTNVSTIVIKRISGDDAFDGILVNVYNSANVNVAGNISTNLGVGSQGVINLTLANPNKVSAVQYTLVNNKQIVCNNVVEKTI